MNNKLLTTVVLSFVSVIVFAQNPRAARIAKQGGEIIRKGTFEGKVSIVNRGNFKTSVRWGREVI